ncbi:putative nuclear factor of activated T-cells cytoplasmic 2-like [Scophthalmus maximus]|uniref:Putative nuclear factor of activated T-cells cytoplasmic 2-like n=1 Tax=Scophthalmus maximus TaxID=52904 RepID=A0A2U9BEQ8_SCOMX|nr:putative nuclear factor of activated T-cells cytoplasmic 2-like [Scophthalmus maximus]
MTSGGLGLAESLGQDINQEELDFNDLFMYNPPGEDFGCDKDDPGALFQNDKQPPVLVYDHHTEYVSNSSQNPSSHSATKENLLGGVYDSLGLASRPGNIPAPSPRIEITPSGDSLSSQTLQLSPASKVLGAYRECVSPASSNSSTGWPVESYSPVASPCISPSVVGGCGMGLSALDLCPGLQGIHTSSAHSSPGASPRNSIIDETFLLPQTQHAAASFPQQRSRSVSPHGKRAYEQAHSCQGGTPVKQRSRSPSPIPSPHEQQGSHYLHQYQAQAEFQAQVQTSSPSLEEEWSSGLSRAAPSVVVQSAHGQAQRQDCVYGEVYDWAVEQERTDRAGAGIKPEAIYMVPAVWPPSHPYHHTTFSGLSVAPFLSFEWSLPSESGQYELLMEQQPRSHHRAHYETEGSRGAVKTPKGGHPEVQLRGYQGTAPLGLQVFIGTADERLLKPHAFYQVHRITGKTVTTPSMERMINGTKVLEIPLEPKNHMRVMIDCVGILKLRNADIELRNGETDIGRKNTRVRLVFRVHIPSGGQLVSLQVASDPIECSQRSAQELPSVERQDLDRCSVLGGQQMVLTGQNFTPDSKVMFSEKTQDGQQIWEVDATVDKDKTQANMLFVEVPPYRDSTICHPAKVNFYVINGKKKRSQPQHFVYTPVIAIKAEPPEDYQLNSYGYSDNWSLSGLSVKSRYHHQEQDNNLEAVNVSPTMYHLATVGPRVHVLTPDPLDDQSAYYQSRSGSLLNSAMLYHTANQHYSSCGATPLGSSPMASHSASTPSQCVGTRSPAGKPIEGPQVGDTFEACLTSRQQTTLPLGKSPPSRYIHAQAQAKAGCRADAGGGNHEDWPPERVTVKQENLSYAYLEDVNDIIRRDLKGHNGE